MIRLDCHIHTYPKSECSVMTPYHAVEAARDAGMDGIVITEHDYLWRVEEVERLKEYADGELMIFPGVEVACREGHFLAYGLRNMEGIYLEMPVRELIELAHRKVAAVVVAHPFRYSRDMGELCAHLDIDGVEIDSNNTNGHGRVLAEELADSKGIFKLIASDAHSAHTVGEYYTSFPDSVKTIEDIASYILEKRR